MRIFSNGRWFKRGVLLVCVVMPLLLSLALNVQARSFDQGFGVGNGDGLEVGINMAKFNQIKAQAEAGLYDRPCTPEEHDPTVWHSLVNTDALCHYDHQHGDDPNYVNDLFGVPGLWFDLPGQSITYPWQTFKAKEMYDQNDAFVKDGKMENNLKHEGYVWIVRRDQTCPKGYCITDFRLLAHAVMGAGDMPVRFHSYSFEARVCADSAQAETCGIVRTGGWADMGKLMTTQPDDVRCGFGVTMLRIPIAADSLYFHLDEASPDEIRCHPMVKSALPDYPSNEPVAEWWAHQPLDRVRYQLRAYDPIGNVDVQDPAHWQFYCAPEDMACKYDASIMTVWIGYVLKVGGGCTADGHCITVDPDDDGYANYRGFIDRWGENVFDCTAVSLDCIPINYDHVPMHPDFRAYGESLFTHDICRYCEKVDMDISPPGKRWITWFYRYSETGHEGNINTAPVDVAVHS